MLAKLFLKRKKKFKKNRTTHRLGKSILSFSRLLFPFHSVFLTLYLFVSIYLSLSLLYFAFSILLSFLHLFSIIDFPFSQITYLSIEIISVSIFYSPSFTPTSHSLPISISISISPSIPLSLSSFLFLYFFFFFYPSPTNLLNNRYSYS